MELPFGTASPIWNAMPTVAPIWPSVSMAPAGRAPNGGAQMPTPSQIRMSTDAFAGATAVPAGSGFGAPAPYGIFGTAEVVAPTAALLAAVAMRRGQPAGPGTDAEIEEFLNDALDLIPGTADVEVRCEGGRVTLTGSVPHKRHKRDVGEIAWAIPVVTDVQNNATIVARRRGRASTPAREADSQAGPIRKHG